MTTEKTGFALAADAAATHGTGFTLAERREKHLEGLLPPVPTTIEDEAQCVLEVLKTFTTNFHKALYLQSIHASNETLFFYLLLHHVVEVLPIAYTPAVADICLNYSHCWRFPKGLFLAIEDKGRVGEILNNAPQKDVDMIVITDGERILGLGDIGINGMAIPAGKLGLYTAFAGVDPAKTLPITLDVGTNRDRYLNDPHYLGHKHPRVRGAAYDEFVEEVFVELHKKWPHCVIQFEDFGNCNAFRLLDKYSPRYCCFSDDIQGTGSIVVAGFISAARVKKTRLSDERVLFFGAGEAGTGAAEQLANAMVKEGLTRKEAEARMFLFDIDGLVTTHRSETADSHKPFVKDMDEDRDLVSCIRKIRPTAIVGLSTVGGAFTEDVIRTMAEINERPVIFALSNPNSKSECSAEDAYRYSDGRALFASGSPFAEVDVGGRHFVPRQGNNAYIYPPIGLAGLLGRCRTIESDYLLIASETVASLVTDADLAQGSLYPPFDIVRDIVKAVTVNILKRAFETGNAQIERPDDLEKFVADSMYEPHY